ncbi:MAG: DUF4373 domain-containing protein, partial [Cytophagaceae bacterium]|nr:DUF4373 domain-containing protein [Cytophagaceae bacterium]
MRGPKLKQGLDYFPMATRNDSRYKVIRALHGDTGYVILNTLLQDIHGENGYYIKWNDRLAKIFSHHHNFPNEITIAVIKDCFVEGIFNEGLFRKYQILTSEEIQQVWINVAKERKEILFNQEYLLINILPYLKQKQKQETLELTGDPGQELPEEFFDRDRDIEPNINSNNPGYNLNNPAHKKQAKEGKEAKEGKQAKEAKQVKEESKRSKIFNFSHSADFSFPLEISKKIIDIKKIKLPDVVPKRCLIIGKLKKFRRTNQPEIFSRTNPEEPPKKLLNNLSG